jgi:SAM-dependent methyltransferase
MEPSIWNIGSLLATSGNYWQTFTLHTGIKLDIFSAIGDEHVTAENLAPKIGADLRGLRMLLNALSAMQLLKKTDRRYANTKAARKHLCKDSEQYIGYMIQHHSHLVPSWARLDEAVVTGKPVRSSQAAGEEAQRKAFLMGMFNNAMAMAPRLVETIDLGGRKRLLDLGGGPGTYAIHFCLHNPGLQATVLDLPTTREFAQATIAKFGLVDRIKFHAANFVEEAIPRGYDVAWLSHVLHGKGLQECHRVIRKTVAAMNPGALILIHEFILDNSEDGPLFPALFSLNMLTGTQAGQAYTEAQLMEMLASAGANKIQRTDFIGPTQSGIILGSL